MSRVAIINLKNKRISCFAYSDTGCSAATRNDCENCPFYKTKQQVQEEQIRSEFRIRKKYGVSYKEFIEAKGLC